jgi:hypothetical protein
MLSGILGLIGIIPNALRSIDKVTDAISNERLKKIQAKTDEEKIAAEERVKSLEAQRDALVAEVSRSPWPTRIQSFIGACVAFLIAKLLVWDKALGTWTSGHTDPLGTDLRWITMTVIGFYFLASTASILKK